MSGAKDETAAMVTEDEPRCDHICLKDDGHVERGEPHFYGYEHPSPRAAESKLAAAEGRLDDDERIENAARASYEAGLRFFGFKDAATYPDAPMELERVKVRAALAAYDRTTPEEPEDENG